MLPVRRHATSPSRVRRHSLRRSERMVSERSRSFDGGASIFVIGERKYDRATICGDLPQALLDDLYDRLKPTQWSPTGTHLDWNRGTNSEYLRELHAYWLERFDWRLQESIINRFDHFRADIDGIGVHFIHERGKGDNSLPIILTNHGYPDSFLRFSKVIRMLTDPGRTAVIRPMPLMSSFRVCPATVSRTNQPSRE